MGVELQHDSFTIAFARDDMLAALRTIGGVVEQSQVLQILSHIKIVAKDSMLCLVATDSEVEMTTTMHLASSHEKAMSAAIPGRKILDICKSLPAGSDVQIFFDAGWAKVIGANEIEFTLSTLPAAGFPVMRVSSDNKEYQVSERNLHALFSSTAFAMAHHDVRHFLNGMQLTFSSGVVKSIATDGHRLALHRVGVLSDAAKDGVCILPESRY